MLPVLRSVFRGDAEDGESERREKCSEADGRIHPRIPLRLVAAAVAAAPGLPASLSLSAAD